MKTCRSSQQKISSRTATHSPLVQEPQQAYDWTFRNETKSKITVNHFRPLMEMAGWSSAVFAKGTIVFTNTARPPDLDNTVLYVLVPDGRIDLFNAVFYITDQHYAISRSREQNPDLKLLYEKSRFKARLFDAAFTGKGWEDFATEEPIMMVEPAISKQLYDRFLANINVWGMRPTDATIIQVAIP